MSIGPVEYLVVAFPGNRFNGDIAPALAELVASDTVRIIDLVFVTVADDGTVTIFEYDEIDGDLGFAEIDADVDGVLSEDDARMLAAGLAPGTSAALIVWEDRWALPLATAIRAAGGVIVGGERIPHEVVLEAIADLEGVQ